MNKKSSVQAAEERASERLFAELKQHLDYTSRVYNLAFGIQRDINGKKVSEVAEIVRSHFMILMRITDFLRCAQLLSIKGYPEQAGTLTASVFELAHTAHFFMHAPEKAKVWLETGSIQQEAPRDLLGKSWKEVVAANCKHAGEEGKANPEYRVYQQLCWMKHSLPKMQDMRIESDGVSLVFGPHTDEHAINHAWFALEHIGRLTEFVVSLLVAAHGNDEIKRELAEIGSTRDALHQKAIRQFGQGKSFGARFSVRNGRGRCGGVLACRRPVPTPGVERPPGGFLGPPGARRASQPCSWATGSGRGLGASCGRSTLAGRFGDDRDATSR